MLCAAVVLTLRIAATCLALGKLGRAMIRHTGTIRGFVFFASRRATVEPACARARLRKLKRTCSGTLCMLEARRNGHDNSHSNN